MIDVNFGFIEIEKMNKNNTLNDKMALILILVALSPPTTITLFVMTFKGI